MMSSALAIWLPAPLGLTALGALRARVARWSREDTDAADLVDAIVTPVTVPARAARRPHAVPVPRMTPAPCAGSA